MHWLNDSTPKSEAKLNRNRVKPTLTHSFVCFKSLWRLINDHWMRSTTQTPSNSIPGTQPILSRCRTDSVTYLTIFISHFAFTFTFFSFFRFHSIQLFFLWNLPLFPFNSPRPTHFLSSTTAPLIFVLLIYDFASASNFASSYNITYHSPNQQLCMRILTINNDRVPLSKTEPRTSVRTRGSRRLSLRRNSTQTI